MSHEPSAMSHEPATINNRLLNELFDYILQVLAAQKFQSFKVSKLQTCKASKLKNIKIPIFQDSKTLRFQDSKTPGFQDAKIPRYIRIFSKMQFESYQSQMKQNNAMELLGSAFLNIYNKHNKNMRNT